MEFIFELIFELILEGSIEICSNKKVNRIFRFLAFLILLVISGVFFFILTLISISCLKNSIIGGIFILLIEIVLLILGIIKFKKEYQNRVKER